MAAGAISTLPGECSGNYCDTSVAATSSAKGIEYAMVEGMTVERLGSNSANYKKTYVKSRGATGQLIWKLNSPPMRLSFQGSIKLRLVYNDSCNSQC